MATSIKEIGKKAEDLIEQGREADQNISNCQARVAAASSQVATTERYYRYSFPTKNASGLRHIMSLVHTWSGRRTIS